MMKLIPYRYFSFLLALGFTACSSSYTAMQGESDDLYFMASDNAAATAHAVPNNTPGHFEDYEIAEGSAQENFSAKNVNPEYIAKYQIQSDRADDEIVYFDDAPVASTEGKVGESGDINVYNNFYGYNNPRGSAFNSNPWMYNSFGMMGGFYPRFGYGGFYDPFWSSPFAFRPGLSISLGFGFGNSWGYRPYYGGFYDPFYDPFWDPFWSPALAYSPYSRFYGYGGYYNRPIIINNIYEGESRNLVRAARTRRGSTLSGDYRESRTAIAPSSTRTVARRSAISRTTSRSRVDGSDFSRSENDYYNSRVSAEPTRRSINSAAMTTRTSTTTRSNRDTYTPPRRSSRPSVTQPSERSSSRSYYEAPRSGRSTSPSYNRSTSPSRQRNISTPSRTRSSSYTPSRSSSSSRSSSFSSGSSSSRSSGGSTSGSSGRSRRGGN
ncbi:hypothetical protein QWY93_03015 [Echinicola jeungdonensis]|uniref:Vitellogenin II n=1 Tax=Echinicola jeungdonensis TaxID=709343 RepID=A0ABV5J0W8_9BACT|nr:hypothetical protein [Echinicola jeungdonensis]MDN3668298.1 hypothetical protein [Echinicola jeungdonensis]